MSLRRQFVLVLAAFSVALAGCFGLLAWQVSSDALEAELDRRLLWLGGGAVSSHGIEGNTVMNLRPGFEDDGFYLAVHERLKSMVASYADDAFLFDGDPDGDYRALVTASPPDSFPIGTPLRFLESYRETINRALRDPAGATTREFPGEDGTLYKYGFLRVGDEGVVLGLLIPADFFEPLGSLSRALFWGSLAALVVAVVLGGYLAGTIARPLERIGRSALRIQRGHLDRAVESERGVELGRLARAMERMRVGIVERDEQLRLMLAQVAHEIRNPLGGLELFAAAAAESDDPAERRRLIGRVRREVEALNFIINDFLTFARPLQPRRQGVDLRHSIREAVELGEGEWEREGVTLEVRLPDEPLMAAVDPDQIKRCVFNLLRNAADAGSRVQLEAGSLGSEIVITVADNGPGVAEDRRERIFEPFITDKERGAGLGLAIVRKVAEAHGGRVEVGDASDPVLGNGAEFRLYLVGLEEPPVQALSQAREKAFSVPSGAQGQGT